MKRVVLMTYLLAVARAQVYGDPHDDEDHLYDHPGYAAIYSTEALGGLNQLIIGSLGTFPVKAMLVLGTDPDEEGLVASFADSEVAWETDVPATSVSSGDTPLVFDEEAMAAGGLAFEIMVTDGETVVEFECPLCADMPALSVFLESELLVQVWGEGSSDPVAPSHITRTEDLVENTAIVPEHHPSDGTMWRNMLIATLLVSLMAPLMILVAHFGLVESQVLKGSAMKYTYGFAAGTLLAVSLIHLIPEGLDYLVIASQQDLHVVGWKGMTVALAGFFGGTLVTTFDNHSHSITTSEEEAQNEESVVRNKSQDSKDDLNLSWSNKWNCALKGADDDTESSYRKPCDFSRVHPIVWTLTVGESLHNFCDGLLIGAAALACDSATLWTVVLGVAAHEIPQELSDYFSYMEGRCTLTQIMLLNSISALSAVLGGVVMLLTKDAFTDETLGMILLATAGLFIQITTSELIPSSLNFERIKNRLLSLLVFIVGAVVVSLPLMMDTHCDSGHASSISSDAHGH
jgi:zinc transporter ZupT